jgi:hypothetical protein
MRKMVRMGLAGILSAALLTAAAPAFANDGDVIKEGRCSGISTWKLKISPENSNLEMEFEVDSNIVGQTWRYQMAYNGSVIAQGTAVTKAPSGSFEIRRLEANQAGQDVLRARALNPATGETCQGQVTADL